MTLIYAAVPQLAYFALRILSFIMYASLCPRLINMIAPRLLVYCFHHPASVRDG